MGQDISGENQSPAQVRGYTKALLRDLQALERMLEEDLFETGIRRIGAEQEMFLVNEAWRPASAAMEVLEKLEGPYTPELALYNLEANVEPRVLEGRCFSDLDARVRELVDGARAAAQSVGAEVVLTGILPTLSKSDVTLDNITPKARYYALDTAFSKMRAAVNSPLLFGKQLWDETRIALFQQSVDTRRGSVHMRDMSPRVRFGEQWVERGVTELFQEDIARFRVLLTREIERDPMDELDAGQIPPLSALTLHNGTVYRWNRPCYGIGGGKPHLRIECRVIPSGPSIIDEVANAAFWIGMVLGGREAYGDVRKRMDFGDAKSNFLAAARNGLKAGFRWMDGVTMSAPDLILEEAIPVARAGLAGAGVDSAEIDKYLGVVEDRVSSGSNGARWMTRSLRNMRDQGTRSERLAALTSGTVTREKTGQPGHLWDDAKVSESGGWRLNYERIEQLMTTSLFTVHEEELVDMVAFLMDRKQIRHVLVEDDAHALVGMVSYRSVLRLMAEGFDAGFRETPPVKEIMERNPTSVSPETPTLEAIDLMRRQRVSCLPVVNDGKLVGIVSETDFMPLAYDLLEDRLGRVG
jgi:CBS domain-containing protein